MSASPAATAVTTPSVTVATAVLDDCHAASDVTDRLELSGSAAVAVNCVELPTAGTVPFTVTELTLPEGGVDDVAGCVDVDGVDGELLHAAHPPARAASNAHAGNSLACMKAERPWCQSHRPS